MAEKEEDGINDSPIEEVRLTVPPTDDNTLPVLTLRTWVLGIPTCIVLAMLFTFFVHRKAAVSIPILLVNILLYVTGKLMAKVLPRKQMRVPGTSWSFSLNPGPFNMKEHCLLGMLVNNDFPSAFELVTVVKVFYHRSIRLFPAFLVGIAIQLLGFGLAGVCIRFLVQNPYMWWPATLVDVSYYRAIHEAEKRQRGQLTRLQFLLIVAVSSFAYHMVPVYFFPSITALSFICWIWKDSVTAQQIGSGLNGLGLGSFAIDWMTISTFLGSPLATPMFVICNMFFGCIIILYVILPISYWTNAYNAKRFPIFSQELFDADGQIYNVSRIIDDKLQFDEEAYNRYSKLYFSAIYPYYYGCSFAALTSSISHFALYNGRSMWKQFKEAYKEQGEDIHSRLMKQNYESIPQWWFYIILFSMVGLAILTCELFNEQVQLSYRQFLLAFVLATVLLLPNAVISATTNADIPLSDFFEMVIGYMSPGKPIANMMFRIYGGHTITTAVGAFYYFKLGHYMKIPPKSMFLIQILGTALSTTVCFVTGWWMLNSIPHMCDLEKLPEGSPWTCPLERNAFDIGVTWGLIGPKRMFYPSGTYSKIFLFFIIGSLAPVPFWILSRMHPEKKWIGLLNMPVVFSAGAMIPPVSAVNIWGWAAVGTIFNYIVFGKYRGWWSKYNYVLSSGLDVGAALVVSLASILQLRGIYGINWWGLSQDDHCPLAQCPTEPGIVVEGCPVF